MNGIEFEFQLANGASYEACSVRCSIKQMSTIPIYE